MGALEHAVIPALKITALKKAFGGLPATNGISLEVKTGERRLIIGPNGAGKTDDSSISSRAICGATAARSACLAKRCSA
jgi:ABC-type branched-subunit amino acid transport system ATPase component